MALSQHIELAGLIWFLKNDVIHTLVSLSRQHNICKYKF